MAAFSNLWRDAIFDYCVCTTRTIHFHLFSVLTGHALDPLFKQYAILVVKLIGVPAGLIYLFISVVNDPHIGSLTMDAPLLIMAFMVNQLALTLFSLRMQLILSAFSISVPMLQSMRVNLQSMFYYFALPATVGLELARYAKIRTLPGNKTIGVATLGTALVTDRFVGALISVVISLLCLPFIGLSLPIGLSNGIPAIWLIAALIVFTGILAFTCYHYSAVLTTSLRIIKNIYPGLAKGLLAGCVVQLLFCTGIFLAALAIGIPVRLVEAIFLVSASMLFIVLPISFIGAGPIEVATAGLGLALGLNLEQALAFVLISYLARLIAALEGGIWEIIEGSKLLLDLNRSSRKLNSNTENSDTTADLTTQTISDFGEQWTNFRQNPGYYGSAEFLQDVCGPLLQVSYLHEKNVAEIGSGTGRIVNMLLDVGVKHVTALQPSAAFAVLCENTATQRERITYINQRGEYIPADANMDVIFSIGVLHHIPDPAPVVSAALMALKPGGMMLIWLYGHEGNETYLRFINPLRHLTRHIPHPILSALCSFLNQMLGIYIFCCRFIPLPMRSYMQNVLARVSRDVRKIIIYDQLNPAYARYYRKNEAIQLLADAGFTDVQIYHRHGYSWTVLGHKPRTIPA